jgi:hypothetical protein
MNVVATFLTPPMGARTGVVAPFAEVNGCLLVEVSSAHSSAFEKQFVDLPCSKIGHVTSDPVLNIANEEIFVSELVHAFNHPKHS